MQRTVVWSVVAACVLSASWTVATPAMHGHAVATPLEVSDAAREWTRRVLAAGDHGGRPFAVVDKDAAQIVVLRSDGTLAGISRVLLGRTRGDESVPGVGQRTQDGTLRPEDLTTPAGRFLSQPGVNHTGEHVVWVDHSAALAIHRLRPGPQAAERARRLASADPTDKRQSAGCVVVPPGFYDTVIKPLLGGGPAVVYVLPEETGWPVLWQALASN